jgi:decaprenylphospho-beta-D-erythro-pentofuranosid-2-ulose 2-reductase
MTDRPRILILGATSAIAQAYARLRAPEHATFVLAGRREGRLAAVAADLLARGAAAAESFVIDLAAIDGIADAVRTLSTRYGPPNEVLLAYGSLGEQAVSERDPVAARAMLDTNFTSAALWVLALLDDCPADAPMTVIAIGSVAG